MPSFDDINFSIRYNKNVERKLIFESLVALDPSFAFGTYRYIGFGSLWFVDFVLAHKMLGIRDMTSIQTGEASAKRARFNIPFSCINVVEGDASIVLPELELETGPAIVWLDYEATVDRILSDVAWLCERLVSGSILLVTVNATKERVEVPNESERLERQIAAFRNAVGDLAPAAFPFDFFDNGKYPGNVANTLLKHLVHETRRSGRRERFEMLFNFGYKDNASMITVGGMIANARDQELLRRAGLGARFPFVQPSEQIAIAVPPLTTREKLSLDRLFPADEIPSPEIMSRLGFPLKERHLEAYRRYYTMYPLFGELIP